MDTTAFQSRLTADGFTEIETKRFEVRPPNGEHGHHFTVNGLVLDGAFIITLEGVERTYKPGEIFVVEAGRMHFEAVGSEGVELMVGKKY